MKVMLLEIDTRIKRMLLEKLSSVGLLAMKVCKNNNSGECLPRTGPGLLKATDSSNTNRLRVEIYAEKCSISRIIKMLVTLARDGFLIQTPVKVISIRSVQ